MLGLIPAGVTAAIEEYPVWVGGIQLSSENTSGDGWSYSGNSQGGRLKLASADITGSYNDINIDSTANIYVATDTAFSLTIELLGENRLYGADYGIYFYVPNGTLQIWGSGGTLDIAGSIYADTKGANEVDGFSIARATVKVTSPDSTGIECDYLGIIFNSQVNVSGSKGIDCENLTVLDSIVTANGSEAEGIISENKFAVGGNSAVTAATQVGTDALRTLAYELDDENGIGILDPQGGQFVKDGFYYVIYDSDNNPVKSATIGKAFPLWVGTEQVTTANMTDLTVIEGVDAAEGGSAIFDSGSNTLRLNNATIIGTHKMYGVACCISFEGMDLEVQLSGENTVGNADDIYAISGDGDITFRGLGSINIFAKTNGINFYNHSMTVEGGDITILSDTTAIYGEADNGSGTLTVKRGILKCTGEEYNGIYVNNLNVAGGKVIAESHNESLIADGYYTSAIIVLNEVTLGEGIYVTEPENGEFKLLPEGGGGNAASVYFATDGENRATGAVIEPAAKITFRDEDGTELQSSMVGINSTPVYKGEEPEKKGDAQYSYKFAGWDPELSAVTGDAVYTAKYDKVTNEYTVTFLNEDGTELQSGKVAYGTTPEYKSDEPEKKSDAQYTYKFAGWDPEPAAVTGDASYTAKYDKITNEYTVKFLNDDGTVLQSGKVAYGKTPSFNGDDPVKAGTAEYTYKFSGWTPELTAVTKDAEYTAVYTATAVGAPEYTVKEGGNGTWKQGSGETYKITVNRSVDDDKCFDHFTGVSIDGKALGGGEYTAVRGSTVVTLNAGTLEKLSVGSHTVTVNFDDGKAETTVTVQAKDTVPADNTPKTGDPSRTGLWLGALLVSGAAATVLIAYGRKRKSRG